MKAVSGWIRAAADRVQPRVGSQRPTTPGQGAESDEENDFIYNRVAAHSDDEGEGPSKRQARQGIAAASAATATAAAATAGAAACACVGTGDVGACTCANQQGQWASSDAPNPTAGPPATSGQLPQQPQPPPAAAAEGHHAQHHSSSHGLAVFDLLGEDVNQSAPPPNYSSSSRQQATCPTDACPSAAALAAGAGEAPSVANSSAAIVAADMAGSRPSTLSSSLTGAGGGSAHGVRSRRQGTSLLEEEGEGEGEGEQQAPLDAEALAEEARLAAEGAGDSLQQELVGQGPERELYIYALPLERGKVIYLPVVPWRSAPRDAPAAPGLSGAVTSHVRKVQGEVSQLWDKMAAAEQGTLAHRVYKFGKRMLDAVPAEERLMSGIPKHISRVVIYHPSSVSPTDISSDMTTMTKSYGITAVGKAAAATLMLPLALGVDLIILPGPQILTYYSMWQIYRNTNGAVGTQRMTRFITQGGNRRNIQVHYEPEPRLDHYFGLVQEVPEGVLPEEEVAALVADLDQPELLEPLLSLRSKALQEAKRSSWSNGLGLGRGDSSGSYSALPGEEVRGCAAQAFTRSNSNGSRRTTGSLGGAGGSGGGGKSSGGGGARGDTRRLSL